MVPGVTGALPLGASHVPTPLSIDTLVALVVVHVRVEVAPTVIVDGTAEKLSTVGGPGGAGLTVTVTPEVAVPPAPVAVKR